MSGERPSLTAIDRHKQLLVSEAKIHRELLSTDVEVIRANLSELENKAKSMGTIISVVGMAATTISSLRGGREKAPNRRSSWLSLILQVTRVFAAVRSLRKRPEE